MGYMEQLQSGLKSLTAAGEAGRSRLDGMFVPLNGAIGDLTGAAGELRDLPFISPENADKAQRLMSAINAAQSKVGAVVATYNKATRAASHIEERLGTLKEQTSKAVIAFNTLAGNANPALASIIPTGAFSKDLTPAVEAVKPFPHLLIIQPLKPQSQPYYFNLDTAAFEELSRTTDFRWASQERLTRRPAQQAIGMGEERIKLKGSIYPGFKGGLKQLDTLRSIGAQLQPLGLTTGYGEVLGNWCLKSIEEEQGAFLQGGIPRKQAFTLEFVRYGDDLQNR